jgi:hypothetical protein
VGLHECFLYRILGLIGIPGEQRGRPQGRVLVAAQQILVGHDVASLRALDELRLFRLDGPPNGWSRRLTRDGAEW